MSDFLDHDSDDISTQIDPVTIPNASSTPVEMQSTAPYSNFIDAVQNFTNSNSEKITVYLNKKELAIIHKAMKTYSVKRNDAFKISIAALADNLETRE